MADNYGPYKDAYADDARIEVRGCVVRLDDAGPYIHTNDSHISIGVTGWAIEGGDLAISTDNVAGTAVVTTWASVDETMATRGIECGPSGGNAVTRFRFYHPDVGRVYLDNSAHYALVAGPYCNVWLGWVSIRLDRRGTGAPSLHDRVAELDQQVSELPALVARVDDIDARLTDVEERMPGSFARVSEYLSGQKFADFDADHSGDTFSDADATFRDI